MIDLQIGDLVKDKDQSECRITNKKETSIEVFIQKKSEKGIRCTQWFTNKDFEQRFKK